MLDGYGMFRIRRHLQSAFISNVLLHSLILFQDNLFQTVLRPTSFLRFISFLYLRCLSLPFRFPDLTLPILGFDF